MIEVIHESKPIARKDYSCDACDFLLATLCDIMSELTFEEKRLIVRAKRNGWKVKKGERYIRQFNKDGCDAWTFIGIPDIDAICTRFDMYKR